jgi:hypothetical protein
MYRLPKVILPGWAMISAEQNAFLDQAVAFICRNRLRLPALVVLDAGRPLTFLGGQLLWLLQPALSLFVSSTTIRQTAHLLEEPDALTALVNRLEAIDA